MDAENTANVAVPEQPSPNASVGINLSWENLSYTIGDKKILHPMSGRLVAGRSCGLMGSSGSGKTTLLNALSGRLSSGGSRSLKGRIALNDVTYDRRYRSLVGYVPQDDIIGPMSTPRTAFSFALRTRRGVDTQMADVAVQKYVERLKLVDCRNTIVGIPGVIQGLSGGERKRTNIGMELIADTKLLLCDEPTSGLDSTTAQMVIKTLQDLAREENCTVMFSVHQPTADMLAHFDDILLLCEGQVVYHGPMSQSVAYFNAIGYTCPANFTPTDFYMVLLNNEEISPQLVAKWQEFVSLHDAMPAEGEELTMSPHSPTAPKESYARPDDDGFGKAAMRQSTGGGLEIQRVNTEDVASGDDLKNLFGPKPPMNIFPYPASDNSREGETYAYLQSYLAANGSDYFIQIMELFRRSFVFVYTDNAYLAMMIISHLFFAVVVGVIFNNLEDTVTGIQDRMGLLFMCAVNVCFSHANFALNRFRGQKLLYIREQQVGAYSPFLYFLSTMIADIPIIAISLMLETIIVYFATGLYSSAEAFFYFFGVLFCSSMCAFGFGSLVGASVDNEVVAAAAVPMIMIPMLMCAGLLADNDQIRPYWVWLEKISMNRYGAMLLFHNEFKRIGTITCDTALFGVSGCALQPRSGNEVMKYLGFDGEEDSEWVMWLSMCVFIVLVRLGQLISLYIISLSKN